MDHGGFILLVLELPQSGILPFVLFVFGFFYSALYFFFSMKQRSHCWIGDSGGEQERELLGAEGHPVSSVPQVWPAAEAEKAAMWMWVQVGVCAPSAKHLGCSLPWSWQGRVRPWG